MDTKTEMEEYIAKYLAGEMTEQEIRQLEGALGEEELSQLAESKNVWVRSGIAVKDMKPDTASIAGIMDEVRRSVPEREKPKQKEFRLSTTYSKVAAVLLPLAVLANLLIWRLNTDEPKVSEVKVPYGSVVKYTLPDGSRVSLNAGSVLRTVDFSGDRKVYLSGEGLFEIVKNKDIPFWVISDKASVKVTGTVFNLKAYPEDGVVTTSLKEGRVEMYAGTSPDNPHLELKPGEVAVLDLGKGKLTKKKSDGYEFGWEKGVVRLKSMELAKLAVLLERMYGVDFDVDEERFGKIRITGSVDRTRPLDEVVELLRLALPKGVGVKVDDDKVSLFSE
ncbi:iron dicitrate transporter FecR [Fulvitalea axinellae]|uniref:Iron dicitrate transporter FecR n=1 Tax=Fulvitalea axinellae TaxID=1182444 RepID=A0AAU9CU51_9BACT|nr:iron dicitrate transporter FecR [Fulvitalea axinellae]